MTERTACQPSAGCIKQKCRYFRKQINFLAELQRLDEGQAVLAVCEEPLDPDLLWKILLKTLGCVHTLVPRSVLIWLCHYNEVRRGQRIPSQWLSDGPRVSVTALIHHCDDSFLHPPPPAAPSVWLISSPSPACRICIFTLSAVH